MSMGSMNINPATNQSYMAAARPYESYQTRVGGIQEEGKALYEELKNSSGTIESGGHKKIIDKGKHIIANIITSSTNKDYIRVMLYFYKENSNGTIDITAKSSVCYSKDKGKDGNYHIDNGTRYINSDFVNMGSELSVVDWPSSAAAEDLTNLDSIINIAGLSNDGAKSPPQAPGAPNAGDAAAGNAGDAGKTPASPDGGKEVKFERGQWAQDDKNKGLVVEGKAVTESVTIPSSWKQTEVLALGGTRFYNPNNMIEQIGDYDNPPGRSSADIIDQHKNYLQKTYDLKLVDAESQKDPVYNPYKSPTGATYQEGTAGQAFVFEDSKGNKYQAVLYSMCLNVGGIAVPQIKNLLVSIRQVGKAVGAQGSKGFSVETVKTEDPNSALLNYVKGKHIDKPEELTTGQQLDKDLKAYKQELENAKKAAAPATPPAAPATKAK